MKQFFILLKVNLKNFLLPATGKKKNGKVKRQGMGGIIVFLIFAYSFMGLYGFLMNLLGKESGVTDLGLVFGISMGTLMTLLFTFTNAHAVLFKAKDFDLLMCLPIDAKTIIASKLTTVSVLGYIYFSFAYIPSLLFYLLFNFNVIALICGIIVFICGPMLVLTLSAFLSILIGALTQKMKHKNAITSLCYLVFTLAVVFFSYTFGFNVGSGDTEAYESLRSTLMRLNPLSEMMVGGATGNWLNLIEFMGISIIPFAFFIFICAKFYVALNATSKNGYKNKNFKLEKEKKQGSPMKALVSKEFKTFLGTPVYMTNTIISPIMGCVIFILGGVICSKNLGGMFSEEELDSAKIIAPMVLVALSSWAFGLAPATSVCINMEGKNFWLLKSLPLSEKQILNSKILFSMLLYVPFTLIGAITSIILIKPSIIDAICLILSPIAYTLCFSFVGLLLNTRFYNISWDNPTQAVKSGAGMLLSMLIDMGISSIMITPMVIGIAFNISLSIVILLVGIIASFLFGLLLYKKGVKNFKNIVA